MVPMHKGGDSNNVNNYRPISKLPCLSKILKSLVNNQLKSFLSEHSVLNPHPSGFRANHSTTSAVTLVLNSRKHCVPIFIDLAKTFDTVDHSLLIERLLITGFDRVLAPGFRITYVTDVSV